MGLNGIPKWAGLQHPGAKEYHHDLRQQMVAVESALTLIELGGGSHGDVQTST